MQAGRVSWLVGWRVFWITRAVREAAPEKLRQRQTKTVDVGEIEREDST